MHGTTDKDLISATMKHLKERLAVLLDKENLLNKPQGRKNSYNKTQNNDNSPLKHQLIPQTRIDATNSLGEINFNLKQIKRIRAMTNKMNLFSTPLNH